MPRVRRPYFFGGQDVFRFFGWMLAMRIDQAPFAHRSDATATGNAWRRSPLNDIAHLKTRPAGCLAKVDANTTDAWIPDRRTRLKRSPWSGANAKWLPLAPLRRDPASLIRPTALRWRRKHRRKSGPGMRNRAVFATFERAVARAPLRVPSLTTHLAADC